MNTKLFRICQTRKPFICPTFRRNTPRVNALYPSFTVDCICSLSFAGSIPVEIALYTWNLQLTCFPSCFEFLHGTHGLLCYYLWTESTYVYMFAETQALFRILTQLEAVADSRERSWASGNPREFSIMHSFPYCTEMNTLKWKKEKGKRWRIT